jgi:hypothetical protein
MQPALVRADEVGGDRTGKDDDRRREDQRNHSRRINAKRNVRRLSLVHSAATDALGVLHRYPPLALRDVDDGEDDENGENRHDNQKQCVAGR